MRWRVVVSSLALQGQQHAQRRDTVEPKWERKTTPFSMLTLEVPPAPLFTDDAERSILPQVALETLLAKFDGETVQDHPELRVKYKIKALPHYLMLHIKRYSKGNWATEKNPTIVQFPLKEMDLSPCYFLEPFCHEAQHNSQGYTRCGGQQGTTAL